MDNLVGIQYWLYRGIGDGLASVAGGDHRAIIFAMAAAILFGAVHALMPGHGKYLDVARFDAHISMQIIPCFRDQPGGSHRYVPVD